MKLLNSGVEVCSGSRESGPATSSTPPVAYVHFTERKTKAPKGNDLLKLTEQVNGEWRI